MKFYIASGLQNKEVVRDVANQLKEKGHIHTYDWTKNEHISTIEELREIGQKEKEAVLEADTVIVLLPGGKGTHIELGTGAWPRKKDLPLFSNFRYQSTSCNKHFLSFTRSRKGHWINRRVG
jgi:diacylglycerol kinase family enzyme